MTNRPMARMTDPLAPTFVAPALSAARWAVGMVVAAVHSPHAAWPLLLLLPFSYHLYRALMRLSDYIAQRIQREHGATR